MIYFDNAATTKPSQRVLDCFLKVSDEHFANSASSHSFGRESLKLLEEGRKDILSSLKVLKTHRLIFLSSATEANNLAIQGVVERYSARGKRIITSAVEHPSVLNIYKKLEREGFDVIYLPVDEEGKVKLESFKESLDKNTILVSIMAVNNEVGAINDIAKISSLVHLFPKAYLHVDATQAIGKVDLPWNKIDLFSFSGHKIGGLKGTGALILNSKIGLAEQQIGGGQEYGFRSGTVDVAGAISLSLALKEEVSSLNENKKKVQKINAYLRERLMKNQEIVLNSAPSSSPYILNFSLKSRKASVVVEALSHEGIYVSSVSACSSKKEPISYVLEAMGRDVGLAMNSIRLSFSPSNSLDEAKVFLEIFEAIIERLVQR